MASSKSLPKVPLEFGPPSSMCTRFSTEQLRGACVSADTLVGLEQSETKDKSSLLDEPSLSSQTTQDDIKTWEIDQKNPLNWPAWRKGIQLAMLCSSTLLTYFPRIYLCSCLELTVFLAASHHLFSARVSLKSWRSSTSLVRSPS